MEDSTRSEKTSCSYRQSLASMNSYVRQTDEDEEPRPRRPPCRTIQSDIFGGLLAVMLCLVFNVSAAGVLWWVVAAVAVRAAT